MPFRLPADEVLALRHHSDTIERFDAAARAEQDRLTAPFAPWIAELERPAPWLRDLKPGELYSGPTPLASGPAELLYRIQGRIGKAWLAWKWSNQPDVEPWDTPARLAAWLEDNIPPTETRLRELLSMTIEGRATLARDDADDRDRRRVERRDFYVRARRRALALVPIAPSLAGRLAEIVPEVWRDGQDDDMLLHRLSDLRDAMASLDAVADAVADAAEPEAPPPEGIKAPPPRTSAPKCKRGAAKLLVEGYLVAYLERWRDGLTRDPLPIQKIIAAELSVSESSVSRHGRRWLREHRRLLRDEMLVNDWCEGLDDGEPGSRGRRRNGRPMI